MALVLADRVKETTTSTGTGTVVLAGAEDGFQSFSVVGDGNTTYYAIVHATLDEFEVGVGTYTLSGTTLSRDTVLTSSNSGSKVNFSAGVKNVFVTVPFSATVFEDTSNNISTSGTLTVGADPTAALEVATKQYVDNLTAAAIHLHTEVRVASTANLTSTYDNGTAGVGATLTNSGTQAALAIDGVTLSTSDRVLIKDQTSQPHNGVYTVTNTGSASTNWVLTRATDSDSSGEGDANSLDEGSYYFVTAGTTNGQHAFVCNTSGTIVFGTTNITFAEFSAAAEFTAGTNIDITNRVISTTAAVLTNVSEDTTPQLGGNLDAQGNNIVEVEDIGLRDRIFHDDDTDTFMQFSAADTFRVVTGNVERAILSNTSTIFNETGADVDFRVEGDTEANLLFVDAGNDRVGIANATPSTALDVTGTVTATGFSGPLTGNVTGNADTATAWATGRSLTLSGDVSGTATGIDGTGNIAVTTTIGANSVALGTDTTGSYVESLVAGAAIDLQNNSGEGATPTIDVDLSELSTSTTDGDGDFFVVVDASNAQRKLTKANINNSGFNNDAGFTTNTGTVTSVQVTAGDGLTGGGTVTTSGNLTVNAVGGTGLTAAADAINLDDTAVTPGSYTYASITVDQQGRLTAASSGAAPEAFPSGTVMLFLQTSAPTGWTKDTTNYNEHALRVVTGTVGTGGSVDFSTAMATPSVSGSVSVTIDNATATGNLSSTSAGGTVGNHTLATNRIPAHSHTFACHGASNGTNNPGAAGVNFRLNGGTRNTGGNAAHNHSFSGSSHNHTFTGTAHNHSSSGSLSSSTATINVKYVDVISAAKD